MLDQVFDREGAFIHSVTSLPYFAKFRNKRCRISEVCPALRPNAGGLKPATTYLAKRSPSLCSRGPNIRNKTSQRAE